MKINHQLCACVAAILLLSGCKPDTVEQSAAGTAVSGKPADLSGIWQLAKPITALTTTDGKAPPLLPEAKQLYDQRQAARAKGDLSEDPAQLCKPLGEPRAFLEMGWPFQIAQSQDRVDILYQWNRLDHVIPILAEHEPLKGPFYFGESIGSWQGDTLLVDVVNIRPESWLDPTGLPHSDQLHMVERLRLTDSNTLEVSMHFEDPATYSVPWDTVLTFTRKPDLKIAEDVCLERIDLRDRYWSLNNALKK
ncbi:MAG: hypothetical protein QM808_05810 [Steroidobacteraceae bacterium]